MGTGNTTTKRSFVHDVIVIQRSQVSDLNCLCCGDDIRCCAITQLGSEQGEHGANSLATGTEQVATRNIGQSISEVKLFAQAFFNGGNARIDGVGELLSFGGGKQALAQRKTTGDSGYSTHACVHPFSLVLLRRLA